MIHSVFSPLFFFFLIVNTISIMSFLTSAECAITILCLPLFVFAFHFQWIHEFCFISLLLSLGILGVCVDPIDSLQSIDSDNLVVCLLKSNVKAKHFFFSLACGPFLHISNSAHIYLMMINFQLSRTFNYPFGPILSLPCFICTVFIITLQ